MAAMPRLLAESGRMGDAFPTTLAIAALATAALATAALATAAAHCRHRRPFLASTATPLPSPPSPHPYLPRQVLRLRVDAVEDRRP